jgi:hypothetical protein
LVEGPYEFIHHRPAGFDAVPGQQFGNGLARSAFPTQFDDDILPRQKILETRPAAWLKLCYGLPDGIRVSAGHKTGMRPENARNMC